MTTGEQAAGKVSIIVPIHNRREMLEHLLVSVGAQTYPDIELILVDDGSDDLDAARFEALRARFGSDRPTRYVRKANGGAASARNCGVAESRGAYLHFLDSDDLIFPDAIARLVARLTGSPAAYAIGRIVDVDYTLRQVIGEFHQDDPGNILRSAEWCTHAALYRREAWLALGGLDESLRVGEDTIFQIQVKLNYGDGAACPDIIGVRRHHNRGHLSLDRIPLDEQAKFLVAAAQLITRHEAFRRESLGVRMTSMALFLTKLARIRHRRSTEVDRAFAGITATLLHDSPLMRDAVTWLSAPGANLRLVAALGLIETAKQMRKALLGLGRLRSKRDLGHGAVPEAMQKMAAAARLPGGGAALNRGDA
ncbi:glycosyltransferase family A protein [Sphingosinicella rhizophila]|uniref:Glycosyltransferase family A protein n=1 Tax=Sphingosinicella rhizophila TaxID=3050082 RepID=A0ABU3Q5B5_9SPHN|nr:glycosyltransferase family A protein [Sphingosinicella sp. GR2756]MDT9598264.1 glycosyltransferase family A protein [Sphingosinicella sp. GR2756]